MGSGTDAPPDKPGADGKRGLDDAWTELVGDASSEPASTDPTSTDATSTDPAPDPGDSVSALADELQVGRTAEPDVVLDATPRAEDDHMATMMSGSWAMATRDASPAARASATGGAARDMRESDAEMAAIMGADARAEAARKTDARTASKIESREDRGAETDRPRIHAVAAQPRRMVASEPRRITPRTGPVMLPEDEPPAKRLSLGWAAVSGVVIAMVIWWFQQPSERDAAMRDDGKRVAARAETKRDGDGKVAERGAMGDRGATPASSGLGEQGASARTQDGRRPSSMADDPPPRELEEVAPDTTATLAVKPEATSKEPAKPEAAKPEAAKPEPAKPEPAKPEPTKPEPAKPEPAKPEPRTTPRPGADPRTPPPGTPPEIAAVFVRLPVSPADLPPVGGVGATGVHIDRVEMGASYDKTGCGGVAERFSLGAIDRVNVCLRVVHPRQEEVLSIVWQKNDGSTARRGKIAIKPMHAYRTRAYLVLRREYVGAWKVRIMSADGVELASHAFTITP